MTDINVLEPDLSGAGTRTGVRELVADRIVAIAGELAYPAVPLVDRLQGALALSGAEGPKKVRKIDAVDSELTLMVEPVSHETYVAKPDAPFLVPNGDALLPLDLEGVLEGQRSAGADVLIFPGGYVEAGDTDSLREMERIASDVVGVDLALHLALPPTFLTSESDRKVLEAVCSRSKHQVLVSFGSDKNPLSTVKAQKAYRDFFSGSNAVPWRTDIAGLDAYAYGAPAVGIGLLPSSRRTTPPDKKGNARQPRDKTPHVFRPELLRFVQASTMQRDWYVAVHAGLCYCVICKGRPLDRFTGSDADRLEAHLHNLVEVQRVFRLLAASADREALWRQMRQDAIVEHKTLSTKIGRPVRVPQDLETWARLDRERK